MYAPMPRSLSNSRPHLPTWCFKIHLISIWCLNVLQARKENCLHLRRCFLKCLRIYHQLQDLTSGHGNCHHELLTFQLAVVLQLSKTLHGTTVAAIKVVHRENYKILPDKDKMNTALYSI
jgi:hypothetical protein